MITKLNKQGEIDRDVIDYWVDLIHKEIKLTDPEKTRLIFYGLMDNKILEFFTWNFTGIFAYLITDDMKGGKTLAEVIFYIKPDYRGSLRLVKKYITLAEQKARDNGCDSIKIGGNIGFKDDSFLRLLKRWGYCDDTVSKQIKGV